MKKTRLCELLNIEYPIVQAPMVWVTNAELVAAVSNAGGLGTIGPNAGATAVSTDLDSLGKRLREQIASTRSLTSKPFAVNVAIGQGGFIRYSNLYADIAAEMRVPVAIVSQGGPKMYTKRLRDAGMTVIHVISTVEQASKAEAAGVDAVVAGGYEGGGHSGWDALGTFALIPQVADAVKIPVIAGGGIADGRGLVAALALGAEGIYMGTRFIATTESPAHPNVKRALVEAKDTSTVSVVHGDRQPFSASKISDGGIEPAHGDSVKPHPRGRRRSLKNEFILQCLSLLDSGCSPAEWQDILNSPVPGENTHRVLAGLLGGDLVNGVVPCGQAAGLVKEVMSASDLIRSIVREADVAAARLMCGRKRLTGVRCGPGKARRDSLGTDGIAARKRL